MEIFIKKFNELTTDELYDILKARIDIFVVEQNCAYQDLDDFDQNAIHIFVKDDNEIKGYLRLLEAGATFDEIAIGRVITTDRGKGYARVILEEGIRVARERLKAEKIKIGAQCYVQKMYEKFGFERISDEYLEDGIPHVEMLLDFNKDEN